MMRMLVLPLILELLLFTVIYFKNQKVFHGNKQDDEIRSPTKSPNIVTMAPTPNYNDGDASIRKFAADLTNEKVLNIHVVPHTHDDVGWRKTIDQYYYGYNMSIDSCGPVQSILDTVFVALQENPARVFVYAEMKFFSMWWNDQTDQMKDAVKALIANHQFSVVNGGWCMHDEATTHYMGMIDQTTTGHAFLLRELGVIPTTGWQLDPFGHSATQASLLTAKVGFDALYFGRIDYQDLQIRRSTQECEGLWSASNSSGAGDTTVFWGLTGSYDGNYQPPKGFCFDVQCYSLELLAGESEDRIKQRLDSFLRQAKQQSDETKGNHIMLTMGSDFQYSQAQTNFASLDVLIGSVMDFQNSNELDVSGILGPRFEKVNIFYSTPAYYTKMKYHEAQSSSSARENTVQWTVKRDDFFPYSSDAHSFWTGYFTSRATLKRFERVGSSFLMAARQIDAYPLSTSEADDNDETNNPLFPLEDAVGVIQHHDGVSGTSKQHVADDYSFRLQAGIDIAKDHVIKKLKKIMLGSSDSMVLENLAYCQLLNETICPVSENVDLTNNILYVVVYNPLSWSHSSVVRLPVSTSGNYLVELVPGENGEGSSQTIQSNAINVLESDCEMQVVQKHVLYLGTGVMPPLGAVLIKISIKDNSESNQPMSSNTDTFHYDNGVYDVEFDAATGMIKQISSGDTHLFLEHEWGYYNAFDYSFDSGDMNLPGAYKFRPSTPTTDALIPLHPKQDGVVYSNSSTGIEIHVSFEETWVRQTTRLHIGQPYVEIEYTIGPIPIDDGRGRDIVARYSAPIQTDASFYTDSNGREFLERRRDYRPTWDLERYEPIAGNYYPVNSAIYVEDDDASFSVAVDRSQGGTSLFNGAIELMVHRRLLRDDGLGLDEALDETCGGMTAYPPDGTASRVGDGVIIRGVHRVMVGPGRSGAASARKVMDETFAQPLVFVASESRETEAVNFRSADFTCLREALPPNIALLTLMRLRGRENETFLVRLGHQFGSGEDSTLSQPVTVDLSRLLVGYKVTSLTEMTLSGNQRWSDFLRRRLNWTDSMANTASRSYENDLKITIQPMEILTFEMTVSRT